MIAGNLSGDETHRPWILVVTTALIVGVAAAWIWWVRDAVASRPQVRREFFWPAFATLLIAYPCPAVLISAGSSTLLVVACALVFASAVVVVASVSPLGRPHIAEGRQLGVLLGIVMLSLSIVMSSLACSLPTEHPYSHGLFASVAFCLMAGGAIISVASNTDDRSVRVESP